MYHGILQHRIYLTTYLRQQILERGLDKPQTLGRIFRIVYTGKPLGPQPHLDTATTAQLVGFLSHPNGWWRDTAQRLLIKKDDPQALAALCDLAIRGEKPFGRLHALWTLERPRPPRRPND